MTTDKKDLFENKPVLEAILSLAMPMILSQIILVIYNMADTFFIGLTGDNAKITAITVCAPAFMFLSAIANLFGVGGSAAISRALGRNRRERAQNISAFSFYGCLIVTALYCLLAWFARHPFLNLLGGSNPAVHIQSVEYLNVVVCIGGIPAALSSLFSHLVRSEGRSFQAGLGMILGGILNILLDPLFMFVLLPQGQETYGAAIATALSNLISCLYFIGVLIWLKKKDSVLTFRFDEDAFQDDSAREILLTGLPAFMMTLMENISYATLDSLMSAYGTAAQAGVGVAKKVNMLAHSIVRGMSQGVLPLIAYTYARKNYTRMRNTILLSSLISVGFALAAMTLNLVFARPFVNLFLSDEVSIGYGIRFLRILTLGCPFSAFAYAIISFFQAVDEGKKSFILALLRKGILDIPLMFLLNHLIPTYGIVWATPVTDFICCGIAAILFVRCLLDMKQSTGGAL